MEGIANVNIVKAPKLTEGIENLDKVLDSIAARIDNLDSGIDSIAIQISNNNEVLTTMLDSINLSLHNVSDSISSSNWFLDNCLPNLIGTIISCVFAYSIFYLGLKKEFESEKNRRIYERNNEKEKKLDSFKNTHAAIAVYVKTLEKAVESLNNNIDNFIDSCKTNKSFQLDRLELSILSLDCIRQISISELSLIYVTNRTGDLETKAKCLYNVQNQLDFLSSITEQMKDVYDQNQQFGIQLMNQWNVYKKNIDDISTALVTQNSNNPVSTKFRSIIEQKKKQGENPSEWQPEEWIVNVISPFFSWLTLWTSESHNTNFVPYENSLRTLIHLETQRKALIDGVVKLFDNYKNSINEAYKSLCSNIELLNKNEYVTLKDIV